jgi:lysozyme
MRLLGWLLELLFGKKEEVIDKPEQEVVLAEPPRMERDLTNIIEFIKREEGFREKAYLCSGGKWTVGYGQTEGITKDSTITEEEASEFVVTHINQLLKNIEVITKWQTPLYAYEIDAILSFMYNFGVSKFLSSTLYSKIVEGDAEGIKTQWMRWVYAKRKYQKGLYARRKRELKLFLTGDYSI